MPDPRKDLAAAYEQMGSKQQEQIQQLMFELWEQTLSATKDQRVTQVIICKSCAKRHLYDFPVQVPDVLTRLKAFEVLANQMLGKPAETRTVEVEVRHWTPELIEGASDAELLELASAEDADWEPAA